MAELFETGVVVLSIDTEQIWGYRDCMNEAQFEARFPDSPRAHPTLLAHLCAAGVPATWFVVGGLMVCDSQPAVNSRVPGGERPGRLWYCRPFLQSLCHSRPAQEIGLHGGLTHMVWTGAGRADLSRELESGIDALAQLGVKPRSFSYPRMREAYHELLPAHGFNCFRGVPPSLAWRLGRTTAGAVLRAWEEISWARPPVVFPSEILPGLWTIPASMFLYPMAPERARLIGLQSRIERFRRGLEAAARQRGIFHFCFHPENLVESPRGFSLLDDILEQLVLARDRGDIEVLTMSDVVKRMERSPLYDFDSQQPNPNVLTTDRSR